MNYRTTRQPISTRRYSALFENITDKPQVEITYFVPDNHKSGGEYVTGTGRVRRVDDHNREIVFVDGMTVGIDDVYMIKIDELL